MKNNDLEKRTEGINKTLKVFGKYLAARELVNVRKLLRQENIMSADVGKYFEKNKIKDFSDILFINRKELNDYECPANLYVACEEYLNKNSNPNLIMGGGAMDPEGVVDIDSNIPPYIYESLY